MSWKAADIPDQTGRTAVVTGANTGIGFETARALAKNGAHVVLGCRNESKGRDAVARISDETPEARAELLALDLASLESVRRFAEEVLERHPSLDLLINNAGVMVPPRSSTEEGLELQIGVNYFGHFALTGGLIDALAAPGSRIVTVSSLAHRQGRIDFGSFHGEKPYRAWREYCQSKLADLIFALELQRRLQRAGRQTLSLAAHPGFTASDLQRHDRLFGFVVKLWSNSSEQGALPTLYAATAPQPEPGGYYGPDGFYEVTGYPAPAKVMPRARDRRTAERLWAKAEEITGAAFLSP